MPDVAVHDAKEERERRRREERRVDLLVARHAVRVDELLEGRRERVGVERGRRRRPLAAHAREQRGAALIDVARAESSREGL